jgi:hypothetical protein
MGRIDGRYYSGAPVKPSELWSPKGTDLLDALSRPCRERKITRISLIKDMLPDTVPGAEHFSERDFNSTFAETTCKNNPYYRNLMLGMVENVIRSYQVDGVLDMAERKGAFTDTLGMRFRGKARGLPESRTCFCDFSRAKAEKLGISVRRAIEAFEKLDAFVAAGRARRRPADGYYITVWRLMLRYPELLMWEHLWHHSYREFLQMIYRRVKAVGPDVFFGSHIFPNHSMNPVFRAEQDLTALAPYHDFIKVPMYYNCGGARMASYIESVGETIWGDIPSDELL